MPKKGLIKCKECNKEFEGILPDNQEPGYSYMDLSGEIDKNLSKQLQYHHFDTATVKALHRNIGGHKYFDVFLDDGSKGKFAVFSYCVIYTELKKERE